MGAVAAGGPVSLHGAARVGRGVGDPASEGSNTVDGGRGEAEVWASPQARHAVGGPGRSCPTSTGAALPALIDIGAVAASLGVSVRHVRRLVAERRIPFVKVGHFVRFTEPDIRQWVEDRRVEPVGTR